MEDAELVIDQRFRGEAAALGSPDRLVRAYHVWLVNIIANDRIKHDSYRRYI